MFNYSLWIPKTKNTGTDETQVLSIHLILGGSTAEMIKGVIVEVIVAVNKVHIFIQVGSGPPP